MPPRRSARGTGANINDNPNNNVAGLAENLTQIAANLNAGRANNGEGSSNTRRGYSYKTFIASNPNEFYGNEGVVGLMSWFKNVESKLNITKCADTDKEIVQGVTIAGRRVTLPRCARIKKEMATMEGEHLITTTTMGEPKSTYLRSSSHDQGRGGSAEPDCGEGYVPFKWSFCIYLFDSRAYRSFVSLEIRPLLEQKSKSLDEAYTIEYANGHEYEAREILLNCGKTLFVQGDKSTRNLKIISAIKMHKYLEKECFVFLAHAVEMDRKVKSIRDIPVVKNYPEVFPEDLPGPPPLRQVEFQINLIPGAAPVAKAPYRLSLQEMQDKAKHEQHLNTIMSLLKDEKLYAKFSKYEFWLQELKTGADEIKYLNERAWIRKVDNLRKLVMDEAHRSRNSIHPGADTMYMDVKECYWWPATKRDIAIYVGKCLTCAKDNAEHQKPSRLLQQPKIPVWKWEKITMDLVTRLPRTSRGHDSIWVIVDWLTKSVHFLLIREEYPLEKFAKLYINEIVSMHGVPLSIISDRDGQFRSCFWRLLQKALGTQLDMSTAYHPQTNGHSERMIQTLEDMLRACVIDLGGSWDIHLPMVEFSYNNSYHTSIKCAPFEALYGRKCRSPLCWLETGDRQLTRLDIIQETIDKIMEIKERLKTARSRQKSYANNRKKLLEFQVEDQVPLKVSSWKGTIRFRKRRKLNPRYTGPFKVLYKVGSVAYRLKLPQELSGIHNVFHVSNLKKCLTDEMLVVPLK
nr:putative reverse transcriptase domain-containing protein [Tanacetum cinerariifolium]